MEDQRPILRHHAQFKSQSFHTAQARRCRRARREFELAKAMRYPMPNYPCEFEIPDAWLTEAGMDGFTRTAQSYRSTAAAVSVPLREVEPPYRTPWTPKDARGFERARLAQS